MNTICLDIGGTSIKGGYFINNNLVGKYSFPSYGDKGLEEIKRSIITVINYFLSIYKKCDFIGISTAGNIDPYNGCCVYASNNLRGYTGFKIKEFIEEKYKINCVVENDAVSALFGELDENISNKNVFMITLGTGVGAVLFKNNEVFYGDEFDLGKFAHHVINENGNSCDCGNFGCAEKEVSSTGLKILAKYFFDYDIESKDVFNLYRKKNNNAKKVLDLYFAEFKIYLEYIKSLGVDYIIIGGGLIGSKDIFFKYLKEYKDTIIYAKNGNDAGIIGINNIISRRAKC